MQLKKNIATLGIIWSLPATILYAQNDAALSKGETKVNLMYSAGLPMGAFKQDFIGNAGILGGRLEIMHYLSEKIAVGGGVGFQDFYEKKPRALYPQRDGSDLSAVLSHSLQVVPLQAQLQYFPTAGASRQPVVLPFLQAGGGVNLISYKQLVGSLTNASDVVFRPAFHAGGGVRIPFGKYQQNGVVAGAHYYQMRFNRLGLTSVNQLHLQVGIQLKLKADGGGGNERRWQPGSDRYRDRWQPNRGGWW